MFISSKSCQKIGNCCWIDPPSGDGCVDPGLTWTCNRCQRRPDLSSVPVTDERSGHMGAAAGPARAHGPPGGQGWPVRGQVKNRPKARFRLAPDGLAAHGAPLRAPAPPARTPDLASVTGTDARSAGGVVSGGPGPGPPDQPRCGPCQIRANRAPAIESGLARCLLAFRPAPWQRFDSGRAV